MQLALVGFVAIYLPVVVLLGVTRLTSDETFETENGTLVTSNESGQSGWITLTVILLVPLAAALAWWWAGRAVRPIIRMRTVAEQIEATDLSRRIALSTGPDEITGLAASFDAMLDRLERSADEQRRLLEETSHELRTPIAVLTTNAEVLLAHPTPTLADYRSGLERSASAASRLQRTLDELLVDARARSRAIERHPVDLGALVADVIDELRPLAAAGSVELDYEPPAHAFGAVDAATVRRAVANLVDNAVRHAPARSAVNVTVGVDGPTAHIAVNDHGAGIAVAERERIFDRFWTRRDGGAGLGLPIARQVAEAHGGTLTVESPGPAGDGAVFHLTLRV
jgi:signal transduction histidine kinase